YDGVNDVRVLAVNVQADTSRITAILVGQPFGQFLPVCAAVCVFIDRAIWSATIESKGRPPAFISSGIQRVRTFGFHSDIAHTGVVVDLQDLRPGLPAVGGLIHSALRIRAPQMS